VTSILLRQPKPQLRQIGVHPKKGLGQNFLNDEETARRIVEYSGVGPDDSVLEIGAGLGALTHALLEVGCHVTAVERDEPLIRVLSSRWKNEPRLTLVHADILSVDFASLCPPPPKRFRVVSNLPYSISTPVLERLVEHRGVIDDMTLLLQEEVVDRIVAAPGGSDYGRLSVWLQIFNTVESGPRIPRESFHPVPDVESKLVKLRPRANATIPEGEAEDFLAFVGRMFRHRRKTILNGLRAVGFAAPAAKGVLDSVHVAPDRRPQTLSTKDFWRLFLACR